MRRLNSSLLSFSNTELTAPTIVGPIDMRSIIAVHASKGAGERGRYSGNFDRRTLYAINGRPC